MDSLLLAPARAQAGALARGEVSAAELAEAYLARIEVVQPQLNAVASLDANALRSAAARADEARASGGEPGPLAGLPFSVKDNLAAAGLRWTAGTLGRKDLVADSDATIVARMRKAGGLVLAKTNLPELGLSYETDNLIFGRTNNPYDLERTPGGSSGGEAALVAVCGSPLGLANDSAGSARIPAGFCGVAGFKPTLGRIPSSGHFPTPGGITGGLVHEGLIARTVDDLAWAAPLLYGPDGQDPDTPPAPSPDPAGVRLEALRIAVCLDNGIAAPNAEIRAAVERAAEAFDRLGARVVEARPAGFDQSLQLLLELFGADGGALVRATLAQSGTEKIHPLLEAAFALGAPWATDGPGVAERAWRLDEHRRHALAFWNDYDLLLSPVSAEPAVPHGTSWERLPSFSWAVAHNLTGWPAASVPGAFSEEGLPIGVHVAAAPWREDRVLAAACAIEASLGGWKPSPFFRLES